MEEVGPEERVGDEEAADLAARVVKLVRAPVGVNLVLVEHAAVEGGKALGVRAEAARHPVEDHADARLVAGIDEVHELLGVAVARGGGVVAGGLVAPGAVKGVLVHGHDLDVRVAHVLGVGHKLHGEVVVGVDDAALRGERVAGARVGAVGARLALRLVAMAAPAAEMYLEDVKRLLEHVALGARLHVGAVRPVISGEVKRARRRAGNLLGIEAVRVRLVELAAVRGLDEVLVERLVADPGNEALPDAARLRAGQRVGGLVPAVEVADDVHALDVGGPDGEVIAARPGVVHRGVRAQLLVAPIPLSAREQEQVVVAQIEGAVERFHVSLLRVRYVAPAMRASRPTMRRQNNTYSARSVNLMSIKNPRVRPLGP